MNTFEIEIDSYTFFITVTYYFAGYAAKTYGPPEDCYEGCPEEVEWEVSEVICCDEDGNAVELSVEELKDVVDEYSELIEEKLLEIMKDEAESQDYDDFDDGYDGY